MKITDKFILFFSKRDVCSNFYPCVIFYDGHEFNCSEQLFMYLKAIFFKDSTMATNILKSKTPQEAKRYGRMIRNFDTLLWDSYKDDIMLEAIKAKYGCCISFRKFVEEYKDKTFVEASPYDKIWGIGLSETDPDATDPSKWKGENRLGKCINKFIKVVL